MDGKKKMSSPSGTVELVIFVGCPGINQKKYFSGHIACSRKTFKSLFVILADLLANALMFGKFMIIFAGKWPVGSDTRTYNGVAVYHPSQSNALSYKCVVATPP